MAAKNGARSLQNGGHMTKRLHSSATRILLAAVSLSVVAVMAAPSMSQAGAATPTKYYVSLGDSYSVGYQPKLRPPRATAGYTALRRQETQDAPSSISAVAVDDVFHSWITAPTQTGGTIVGCSGTTFNDAQGVPVTLGPTAATGAVTHTRRPLRSRPLTRSSPPTPGQIGLITVSIGGNDVTACAADPAAAISCVEAATTAITTNVKTLARGPPHRGGAQCAHHRADLPRRPPRRVGLPDVRREQQPLGEFVPHGVRGSDQPHPEYRLHQ